MDNDRSESPAETGSDNLESARPGSPEPDRECAQCGTRVAAVDAVATENAVFCRSCYGRLTMVLENGLAEQGRNINYLGAVAGGLLGGLLAACLWWGFTVLTSIQFGLVAVVIGWATGKGVVIMSGNKRALTLQALAVAITLVSYLMATYWVNRTHILRYMSENGIEGSLPFMPDVSLLFEIVRAGFEFWDLIFLAIALWQAWKMPAPMVLRPSE